MPLVLHKSNSLNDFLFLEKCETLTSVINIIKNLFTSGHELDYDTIFRIISLLTLNFNKTIFDLCCGGRVRHKTKLSFLDYVIF